jgi:hypothetical protein
LAALAALVTLLLGCSVAPESLVSPGPSASTVAVVPAPSPTPDACPELPTEPPPPAVLPADLDEATRVAVRKREEYGLRRDLAWVRHVAADPRASTAFGFPLLPEEEQSLFARSGPAEQVQTVLLGYGHKDELGGLYIDNALGGIVVVLWTRDLESHAAAIRALLPECHPVIFRRVRWSEAELRAWQNRIAADSEWFAQIPADARGFGADISENVVTVDISSANPNAAALIVEHFDAPAGLIRVESDGTGAALLPWGTVKGRVRTVDGRQPGANDWMVEQGPDSPPGSCATEPFGVYVAEDGTFEMRCQIGRRTIQILTPFMEGREVIGEGTVNVPADGVAVVEIRLDRPIEQ